MSRTHSNQVIRRPLLKEKRTERGSQRKVAVDFNITEIHMRHIENGYADPSSKLMFKMGHYFGESVYDLFPDLAFAELSGRG